MGLDEDGATRVVVVGSMMITMFEMADSAVVVEKEDKDVVSELDGSADEPAEVVEGVELGSEVEVLESTSLASSSASGSCSAALIVVSSMCVAVTVVHRLEICQFLNPSVTGSKTRFICANVAVEKNWVPFSRSIQYRLRSGIWSRQ